MIAKTVSLWDRCLSLLEGFDQSTTALSLLSSCVYLQIQQYFKINLSFCLQCTFRHAHCNFHIWCSLPQHYLAGYALAGARPIFAQKQLIFFFIRLCQPSSSQGKWFLSWDCSLWWTERSPSIVGWDGEFMAGSKQQCCWSIITFFFSTRRAAVSALCCSIHSSLYLCWKTSKKGVEGLEKMFKVQSYNLQG